jgi:hypothetical protein
LDYAATASNTLPLTINHHPTTVNQTLTAVNNPPTASTTTNVTTTTTTTNRGIPTAASNNRRKKGTVNYTSDEVKDLLVLVERVLPAGPEEWELIARLHSSNYPNHLRDGKKLKWKFYKHTNKKPQTGNPNKSSTDLEASRLKQLINSKVGSTSNFTADEDAFVERTDANFEELLNEALTETSASPGDTSSALLSPTETAVTNEAASAAVRARTDEVSSVATSARAQARKGEVATVAINARRNKGNAVKEAVEKSSGDMTGIMNQIMVQRLLQSQDDLAEQKEERRRERKREERERHREEHQDKQWDRMFGLVAGGYSSIFFYYI